MVVGETVSVRPITFGKHIDEGRFDYLEGTVIYIHPHRRYYVVEFTLSNGAKIRESFDIPKVGRRAIAPVRFGWKWA